MISIIIGQMELIVVQLTLDTSLAVTSVFAVICVFIFASGAIFPWPGLQVRKSYYFVKCFFTLHIFQNQNTKVNCFDISEAKGLENVRL